MIPRSKGELAAEGFFSDELLAPEQAVRLFLARTQLGPPGAERVPLDDAAGRILAEDAVAREDHPMGARSTMDGFAVASAAGVAARELAGEILMGRLPAVPLLPGQAMRIPTGGVLPQGADSVVPIEDAELADGRMRPRGEVHPGEFLTQRADDIRAGEAVLHAGRRIGGPEQGVLATLGITSVPVFVRPRFGIVSSGDELVPADRALEPGLVRDSNRFALAAALRALGCAAVHLECAEDTPDALRTILRGALERCDGIIVSGGSSVGVRDFTPRVVAELGRPGPIVHGLRVKPGKPTMFAAVGSKPILGLPGSPASSLMILEAVARPIVAACTGERGARPVRLEATAAAPFAGRQGWTTYVPARLSDEGARLAAEPLVLRSAHTSLLARAAGFVVLGETNPRVEAGASVAVTLFSSGGAPVEGRS
ncbi:MAG: molybdopterin molybdotransferase MoeA [Vulcanimicrobiaceae bacterium]